MKKNIKRSVSAFLLAALLSTSLAACAGSANTETTAATAETVVNADGYAVTTRDIRKSTDGDTILATPTTYVEEQEGDQERFDSYVWSVEKLQENFDDVIVLDARSEDAYNKEHIVGAVNAKWQAWSNVEVPQDSGEWSLLYSPDVLAEKLAALGIDGSKPVIIYNDPLAGWGEEGRQLWSLRYYGLENTYILNGGISAWKAAGGEVTNDKTVITPTEKPALTVDESYFASTDYVRDHLDTDNILDVRDDREFSAITNSGEKCNGRVPGSLHVWYKDLYHSDGTLLTPAEIRARVEPLGFTTDEPIVAYCTGGIRSGFATIALRIAGYDQARNYDASFSGWAGTDQEVDAEVYSELSVVNN